MGRTRYLDAEERFAFREMKPLGAVAKHRGRGLASEKPSRVDLCDVRDQLGLDASGVLKQSRQSPQQLVVGECLERVFVSHLFNIGRPISSPAVGAWCTKAHQETSRAVSSQRSALAESHRR